MGGVEGNGKGRVVNGVWVRDFVYMSAFVEFEVWRGVEVLEVEVREENNVCGSVILST